MLLKSSKPHQALLRVNRWTCLIALGSLVVFAPPAHAKKKKKRDAAAEITMPVIASPRPGTNGSIFSTDSYRPLTNGNRSGRVGDIVTIQLVENTKATKSNSASMDKGGGISFSLPTTGPLSAISGTDINMSNDLTFKGQGQAAQSNALQGEITAVVMEVLPNGLLRIEGQKSLTLSRGDEEITVKGYIRAEDISINNTVPSSRVSNAQITFTGEGEIANASKQGWLTRFFSWLSPF